MSGEATILHADADAFFASVEQRDDPSLRGRPVAVGGGIVTAASYEARAHGVSAPMGGAKARRLCPGLITVKPRWEAYVEASRDLFRVFRDTAPEVEGLSLEEAFLDVRGLERISGTPVEIAESLRAEVRERVGLPLSVGIARTKFLAKMASREAKPDGLLRIPPDRELAFLHPMRVEKLWGVGPATAAKLHAAGIETVAQIAALAEGELVAILGRASGRHVHGLARNRDRRRVRTHRRRRTIGTQSAFGLSRLPEESIDTTLIGIAERVGRRMRASGLGGRTVILRMRFGDYNRATRSRTLREPTSSTRVLLATLRELVAEAMPVIRRRGLTMLGITVANLTGGAGVQLELPFERPGAELDAALDELRERYGPRAIVRGSLLGRDPGIAAWLLPAGSRKPQPRLRRSALG
ncbi:MAG TPA: DNA polymerase IV [Solirubrobacterales bacterium]